MSTAHAADAHALDDGVVDDPYFGKATGGKIAMWMFIAQDGMSFAGLLLAYGMLRVFSTDWPDPSRILGINLTATATFILICSSLTMVFAVEAAKQADRAKLLKWLFLTILGGVSFLGIQYFEYGHLLHQGIGLAKTSYTLDGEVVNNLFGTTFYAVTGFHGLHVLSGVIYLICIARKAGTGAYTKGGISYSPVELVGLFWHFVDLVWILVFTFIYLL